jgi:hypothetical protein
MKNQKIFGSFLSVFLLIIIACFAPITESSTVSKIKNLNDNTVTTSNSGEYYAVIAACSEYENPKNNIPKILPPISTKKLTAFYNSLLSSSNWKEENIILLVNQDATKEKIINALEEISTKVTENDIFLFSWQGHGSEVPDDNGDEADGTDEIICPHDIDKNTYITDDDLDFYFSNIDSKAQILIFESCLSGGLVGDDDDLDKDGRIIIASTLEDTIGRASFLAGFPMTIGLAVATNQEYDFHANDENGDGFVSIQEAFSWAEYVIYAELAMFWFGIWIFTLLEVKNVITAALTIFYELVLMEFFAYLISGHMMINFPHLIDNYGEELPLIEVEEYKQVSNAPSMPIEISNDFSELPWQDIDEKYWPELVAYAEISSQNDAEVSFKGDFYIGPPDFTFHWDFGDGTTSNKQNPTHIYQQKGSYLVSFTVTDGAGRSDTYELKDVNVNARSKLNLPILQRFFMKHPLLKMILQGCQNL